jgi:hypothetical protein
VYGQGKYFYTNYGENMLINYEAADDVGTKIPDHYISIRLGDSGEIQATTFVKFVVMFSCLTHTSSAT